LGAVEGVVHRLDPTLPLIEVTTLQETVAASAARERFLVVLLTGFAVVAAALAAIGTFGVLSESIARRRRELGVRVAIGASRAAVFGQVLRHGLLPALAGVAVGLLLAAGAVAALRGLLFEVEPLDPLTFAVCAGGLLVVSVLACLGPARWATRVDPTQALRSE
jgi:putative ABC transport system permease protein